MTRARGAVPCRRSRCAPARLRESGFFALLLVLLIFMIAASVLLGDLVRASASRTERDNDTVAVLMQAKQALIARAALDINRPGSLPCPARDTSGVAPAVTGIPGDPCNPSIGSATIGANRNFLVGRLPWSTLRLPELRDKDNEPLWYAISDAFRDVDANRINSNTQGGLKVFGSAPADKVVAIIFAPGAALPWQNRDPSSAAALNNVANYLEGRNDYTLDPGGENNFEFDALPRSATFNDILAVITQQELMDAVENAVAGRIEKELKPWLARYYADWGVYPFAAPFDPTLSSVGQGSSPGPELTKGQFPLVVPGNGAADVRWAAPSAPAKVWGWGNLAPSTCTVQPSGQAIVCDFDHDDWLVAQFSVTLASAGRGFYPRPRVGADLPYAPGMSATGDLAFSSASVVGGTLGSNGDGVVTFHITLSGPPNPGPTTRVTLTLPPATKVLTEQNSSGERTDWFVRNRWDRVTYYAIDSCAKPGGTPCAPTLRLKEMGKPDIQTRALVVLAGRPASATQATDRVDPDPTKYKALASYFEDENIEDAPGGTPGTACQKADPPVAVAPSVFCRARRATGFNDKVVLVGP
ncbi:MAG TPA: hypothetical protein VLD36_08965 [Burkholderiales bacterium]|nr:hypothetical protein [Burkholderiales bacterium]